MLICVAADAMEENKMFSLNLQSLTLKTPTSTYTCANSPYWFLTALAGRSCLNIKKSHSW